MSYFWTSIKRNPDDSTFTFAGQKVRPSNPKSELPLLDIITTNIRNVDYECFAIRYSKNTAYRLHALQVFQSLFDPET